MYWDDEFALDEYDAADWSIWPQLRETVHLWRQTYKEYWGLDEGTPSDHVTESLVRDAKAAHQLAGLMLRMIKALTIAWSVEPGESVNLSSDDLASLRKGFRAQKNHPVVKDRIALELATEFTEQISGADDRAFRLVGLLQGRSISDRSAHYLARVATLYLQGLELESGVMCRAALEAALLNRLKEYFELDRRPPSLDDLVRIAGEKNVLDGYEKSSTKRGWRSRLGSSLDRANRIRRAGNYIVHDFLSFPQEAGAISNAFECIRELMLVLQKLFPPPDVH